MSRGLGKLQRACVETLNAVGHDDPIAIAERIFGRPATPAELVAVRRALRQLAVRRLVVDMGRRWRFGRRHWGTPDAAREYAELVEQTFGRRTR